MPASWKIVQGDVIQKLQEMDAESVHCIVTSPPYFALRNYQTEGQIGRERCPQDYVAKMFEVFREAKRVLRDDGTLWLNIGDSYAGGKKNHDGLKPKDLIGIPWRLAFALQDDGWHLRSDIIWSKLNPMPESVTDRPTKAHEYVFLLSKSARYYFDAEAVKEPTQGDHRAGKTGKWMQPAEVVGAVYGLPKVTGNQNKGRLNQFSGSVRNLRTVWTIAMRSYKGAHFAAFPEELPRRCIKAGTSEKGCCPGCLAPYRRIVERVRKPTRPGTDTKITGDRLVDGYRDPLRHITTTMTSGWKPGCNCGAGEPVPATVLDIFGGSFTSVAVALELGRNGIGIELNPEYCILGERRIAEKLETMRIAKELEAKRAAEDAIRNATPLFDLICTETSPDLFAPLPS